MIKELIKKINAVPNMEGKWITESDVFTFSVNYRRMVYRYRDNNGIAIDIGESMNKKNLKESTITYINLQKNNELVFNCYENPTQEDIEEFIKILRRTK